MIGGILEAGLKILDKVIPDPAQKAAAIQRLRELELQGELRTLEAKLQVDLAQSATNTAEANSADPFARRWRPAVGWICCCGLAYQFLVQPLGTWLSTFLHNPPPPMLALDSLLALLTGLLGLGSLRTLEKVKGAD